MLEVAPLHASVLLPLLPLLRNADSASLDEKEDQCLPIWSQWLAIVVTLGLSIPDSSAESIYMSELFSGRIAHQQRREHTMRSPLQSRVRPRLVLVPPKVGNLTPTNFASRLLLTHDSTAKIAMIALSWDHTPPSTSNDTKHTPTSFQYLRAVLGENEVYSTPARRPLVAYLPCPVSLCH